jgi:prepilin-type N-terminal cleavage/methylation domain-containing protein
MQWKRTQLRTPARGGFTLIELLIVMAIITILLSITAAAVFKGFAVVYRMNTQSLIGKIDKRMDRRLAELRRDVESWDTGSLQAFIATNFPGVSFSQRQMKVIQYKLLKKWSYPMYYQDASFNYWLSKYPTSVGPLYSLNGYGPATAIYARLIQRLGFADTTNSAALPTTPPLPPLGPYPPTRPDQLIAENGGCLALVFEHIGSLDELAPNELSDTNGFGGVPDGIREIVDGWGTPLMYDRFPVTSPNYDVVKLAFWNNFMLTRARLAFPAKFPTAGPQTDPDDPEKLLSDPSNPLIPAQVNALDMVFNNFGQGIPPFLTTFNPQFYPAYTPLIIYSAGPDRSFGQIDGSNPSTPHGLDDLDSYSWRVTVQGQ